MKKYHLYAVVFSVGLMFINCGLRLYADPLKQGGDTGLNVSLKEKVDRFLDSLPVPFNGTILIGVGEKILVHKGYGLANRSFDIPNKPDTKYLSGP